jgi:S-adenosylmethionine:tRNA ribosyltransferase-isomerase
VTIYHAPIIFGVLLSEFDFPLPEELIAQEPLADRAASRMMLIDRGEQTYSDASFRDFAALLRPDDLLVFNNSRVIPARLLGRRSGQHAQALSPKNPAMREFLHGEVEMLLVRRNSEWEWQALVRPGRKIGVGEQLTFGDDELNAEVIARGQYGERTVRFAPVPDFYAHLERLGHVPLPPYIGREDRGSDRERYQTVYAHERGSVAAPTAGLHFTPEVLERIRQRGIETAELTLHVGLGTFQPLRNEMVEENRLHTEPYEISENAASKLNAALEEKRRIVAVGTTTTRTLEYAARLNSGSFIPGAGEADIFIYPPYEFRAVGALLTNFHLPKSSLLMLVSAFAGKELAMRAYEHAVQARYRFFSYGDCMFIE